MNAKEIFQQTSRRITEKLAKFEQLLRDPELAPYVSALKNGEPRERTPQRQQTKGQNSSPRKPVARKPVARKPVARKPVAQKPVAQKPIARKPIARKPIARKPVARKPVARKPVARKPIARKPVARKPAAKKAGTKKSASAKSGAPNGVRDAIRSLKGHLPANFTVEDINRGLRRMKFRFTSRTPIKALSNTLFKLARKREVKLVKAGAGGKSNTYTWGEKK